MTKESFENYIKDIVASFKHLDDFVNSIGISECVFDYDAEIPVNMLVDEFEYYSDDPLIFQAIMEERDGCFLETKNNSGEQITVTSWEQLYDILMENKEKYEKEHPNDR